MPSLNALTDLTAWTPRSAMAAWSSRSTTLRPRRAALWPGIPRAYLAWGLVLAVALLSFYVHLLQEHVERGETVRQAERDAATQALKARAVNARAPALRNGLVVSRRP